MNPTSTRIARGATAAVLVAGTFSLASVAHAGLTTTNRSFEFTGDAEDWTVPADVCSITVDALGASGGNLDSEELISGLGGEALATVAVVPGQTLRITVGGEGGIDEPYRGGFNGGGAGAVEGLDDYGAGGGGATDIRSAPYSLADRLVVAGGGGGAGADADNSEYGPGSGAGGDGGGLEGDDGGDTGGETPGGAGGTQTAGGAAPAEDPTATDGTAGVGGQGGLGTDDNDGGGGGGAGWFGGGGGAGDFDFDGEGSTDDGGGGGGGSGFGPAGVTFETGVQLGDGSLEISWTVDPGCDIDPTTTTTAPASTTTQSAAQAAAVTPRYTG